METTQISFADLKLSSELLDSLNHHGFFHPTPIQEKSIPIGMSGHDLIGSAQTGTGKTLAFCIPLLEKLKGQKGTQALIVCPTREIAMQTYEVLQKVGVPLEIHSALIIGGKSIGAQIQTLRKHPQVLVVTPGRLVDHMERRTADIRGIRFVVLDEADHMLDLGFLPQMRRILGALPKERQTLMFSATFPSEIEQLARQYLKSPQKVAVAPPGTAAQGIEHALYLVDPENKRQAIIELIHHETGSTLAFTRTKLDAEWLYLLLEKEGHSVHSLHSDRSQGERTRALEEFKQGKTRILVATDIMARGIDVEGIAHVINFDIPPNPSDYIHRVGRTARAEATGHASTLATWVELSFVEGIEKQLGKKLPRKEIPGIPSFKEVKAVQSKFGPVGRKGKRVRMR